MRATENSQQEGTRADKDTKIHLGLLNLLLLGQKWTRPIHESFLGQLSGIYILIPYYLYDSTVIVHRHSSSCEVWRFSWFNSFCAGSEGRSLADSDPSVSRSIPEYS